MKGGALEAGTFSILSDGEPIDAVFSFLNLDRMIPFLDYVLWIIAQLVVATATFLTAIAVSIIIVDVLLAQVIGNFLFDFRTPTFSIVEWLSSARL
jgi:hypothetical protein